MNLSSLDKTDHIHRNESDLPNWGKVQLKWSIINERQSGNVRTQGPTTHNLCFTFVLDTGCQMKVYSLRRAGIYSPDQTDVTVNILEKNFILCLNIPVQ